MKSAEVVRAWGRILSGRRPSMSIEITRECPLRCPGCYAYEPAHLGDSGMTLRQLNDSKGSELVQGVLALVDEHRPLHLSLVGGDPLVRYRELEALVPELDARGVYVQIVTSAFREIPKQWAAYRRLNVVVSIDGLQPEHDERRKPATYARILRSIAGSQVTVHCTVTGQMMQRPDYLREFLDFWSRRPEVKKVWMSVFTPQIGATGPEILSAEERRRLIEQLLELRIDYPVLDMHASLIEQLRTPPASPRECIFARTTQTISADLKTRITPCQFGGNPDCSQCGCIASLGLAAVGKHRVVGPVTAGQLFLVSDAVGTAVRGVRGMRNLHETKAAG